MSASMVKKSLKIIDCDFGSSKVKGNKNLNQGNNKIVKKRKNKGNRNYSTILEARQTYKSKEEILKLNLDKLKLIKNVCTVELDPSLTNQLFERAITKKPTSREKNCIESKTAFTEEDFSAFEAGWYDE